MEESPEQPEVCRTRREKERERRRVRDRERRSLMTTEQRERHLARRRRNYQLRRLKSGTVRTDSPSEQPCFPSTTEIMPGARNLNLAESSIAEVDQRRNGVALVGFNHEQEAINPDCRMSSGSEILDPPAASLQGRVRLSHIRRVARSINSSSPIHHILAKVNLTEESTSNDMQTGESDPSGTSKGLRLNRVKHLAWMINSAVTESVDTEHQSGTAGEESFADIKWSIGSSDFDDYDRRT